MLSVERHIGGLCVCIPLAIAAIETVGAFQLTVLSVEPGDWHPLWCGMYALNGRLQRGNRLANIVVHNGQVKEMTIQLTQHIRFFGQTLQAAIVLKRNQFPKNKLTKKAPTKQRIWETYICYVLQWGCRYEDHVGREFSCSQYFECLRLHIQYGHFTVSVYASNGVQFGAIHGILMGACAEGDCYSTHMIETRHIYTHHIPNTHWHRYRPSFHRVTQSNSCVRSLPRA